MATILVNAHPLLCVPFNADTDFTTLAKLCEELAIAQIECDDPELKLAFYARLAAVLKLIQADLFDPIPLHLRDSLTVNTLPDTFPRFAPDADSLCRYCLTLTQLLHYDEIPEIMKKQLSSLLAELVEYFTAEMIAPRWIRTNEGVAPIVMES
nr:hypothetical protein [uncultured Enterobacter sp.]